MNRNVPNPKDGFYSMGSHTHPVPMELFAQNRKRLVEGLKDAGDLPSNAVVLLQAGGDQGICVGDSADSIPNFKQEAYFHWAFGVLEPDNYGAIEVETGMATLFVPRRPLDDMAVLGPGETPEGAKERYRVDQAAFVDEMPKFLSGLGKPTLLLLSGVNTDSGKTARAASFDGLANFPTDYGLLFGVMSECRVIKTEMELEALRYASKISSDAHMVVMRNIKPGMKEYQCESIFLDHCYYYGGCRHVCYTCIVGSGHSGSILHYGHAGAPNDQTCRDGDMVLFDMGAEYYRFCSDITVSYPVNGRFTERQRMVYNAVLRATNAVIEAALPGVYWKDMHLLSNREMLEDLKLGGLLKGDIDDMMEVNLVGRVFQPCGLGHFIGLDVHDVGGYLPGHPERPEGRGLKSLRTARVLKPNMVLTIEPGCYFMDHLLDEAFGDPELSRFLVKDVVESFRGFGGVRIEEVVVIHEDHVEVISKVPRTVEEIEKWMKGEGGEVESIVKHDQHFKRC